MSNEAELNPDGSKIIKQVIEIVKPIAIEELDKYSETSWHTKVGRWLRKIASIASKLIPKL